MRRPLISVLALVAAASANAENDVLSGAVVAPAPLALPFVTQRDLEHAARRRGRATGTFERSSDFLDLTPGLEPLAFPRNSDVRARLLTPELKRTPLVGWIAENLYRSKRENGWCLEVDPGEGEYIVFYRRHLR